MRELNFDTGKFEADVAAALRSALEKFESFLAPGERLFQIAIWTDIDAEVTGISLETRDNALAATRRSAVLRRSASRVAPAAASH